MLIVCPTCASEYRIDATRLGPDGQRVRCHSCQSAWFVLPQIQPGATTDPLGGLSAAEFVEQEWQKAATDDEPASQEAIDAALADFEAPAAPTAQVATPEAGAPGEPPVGETEMAIEVPLGEPPAAAPEAPPASRAKPAAARPLKVMKRRQPGGAAALAMFGALALVFGVWQRDVVVRWAPALAGPLEKLGLHVNTRGLVFDEVSSELVVDPSGRFLVVQSSIINITKRPIVLPHVEVLVRDAGRNTIYKWASEPSRPVLPPGEALNFRTRLAAPPEAGRDIQLRFARASDEVASAKH